MKLLQKATRLYLLWSVPVLVVCGIGFYFLLQRVITWQVDELLRKERREIVRFINDGREDVSELYKKITSSYYLLRLPEGETIEDTYRFVYLVDENDENEFSPFRELRCSVIANKQNYELILHKSMVESDSLMYSIALLTLLLLVMLMGGFMLVNLSVAQRIWWPFYETLARMKDFRTDHTSRPGFPETEIAEFNQLNEVAESMIGRIQGDFNRQRQFIENVAHELQTPVSIINSNVELLAQNDQLTERDVAMLQVISETASRLAKVNSTLLLLSRIENEQFPGRKEVDICKIVENHLGDYYEQIRAKQIQVNLEMPVPLNVLINPVLADTLVRNLVQNAVRHNHEGGHINVRTEAAMLEISNTGARLREADPARMFDKFVKHTTNSDSTGLGLAIVKQICDSCHFSVSYEHRDLLHILRVTFTQEKVHGH